MIRQAVGDQRPSCLGDTCAAGWISCSVAPVDPLSLVEDQDHPRLQDDPRMADRCFSTRRTASSRARRPSPRIRRERRRNRGICAKLGPPPRSPPVRAGRQRLFSSDVSLNSTVSCGPRDRAPPEPWATRADPGHRCGVAPVVTCRTGQQRAMVRFAATVTGPHRNRRPAGTSMRAPARNPRRGSIGEPHSRPGPGRRRISAARSADPAPRAARQRRYIASGR